MKGGAKARVKASSSAPSLSSLSDRPFTIKEICNQAEANVRASWDPDQPLKVYVQAVRQLFKESKVYREEGDYDTAFARCIIIEKLTTELIPNRHPEWQDLSPDIKAQVRKGAALVGSQISELKRLIYQRTEEWERTNQASRRSAPPSAPTRSNSPAPSYTSTASISTAPGSIPALTLRNTVMPAQSSMGFTPTSGPTPDFLAKYGPPTKERGKLKKMFRIGKGKNAVVDVAPRKGVLVEPGTEVDVDDDKIAEEWTVIDKNQKKEAPEVVLERSQTVAEVSTSKMPLPGEEEDEDEVEPDPQWQYRDVTYPNSNQQRPPQHSWNPAQPSLPPQYPLDSNPQIRYNPPSSLGAPSLGWSSELYQQQQSTLAPRSPLPSPPPPFHPPQHAQQWSMQETAGAGLQRSPSRLTVSHQQQQGFTPSSNLPSAPHQYIPPPQLYPQYPTSYPMPVYSAASPTYSAHLTPQYPSSYSIQPHQPPYAPHQPPIPPLPPSISAAQIPKPIFQPYHHAITSPLRDRPQPPSPSYLTQQSDNSNYSQYSQPSSYSQPSAPPAQAPSAPPASVSVVRTMSLSSLPVIRRQPKWSPPPHDSGKPSVSEFGLETLGESFTEELSRTEGGQPLRNLVLPSELMSRFISLARNNTDKGIETCGLLMGTLSHDIFTISNLLIPKQEGTTDTCMTTHEEEQFEFQDQRDLMTLGWIHTHPTQSCFMSSLDLHTHASYQVMLAEAIAIVCAPRHEPSFGIFRLTDPPGLEIIVKCDTPGLFHPHPDQPIYTDTDHGHVQLRPNLKFECDDLRVTG